MTTPKTFIFSGISGSGKGTQIELLKKYIREQMPQN
jgi:thymidylate kinase